MAPIGGGVGSMIAVRFTASVFSTLRTARFMIRSDGMPETEFDIRVFRTDALGVPSEQIYPTDGSAHRARADAWVDGMTRQWVDVDLRDAALSVDGNFAIAMEWLVPPSLTTSQTLAADESEPDARTLVYTGEWTAVPFGTFPAFDAMIRAVVDTPGPLPPQPSVVTNTPDCTTYDALQPDIGFEGHLAATRIVPDRYPFRIDEIRVHSPHTVPLGAICNASLPRRVELYVDTAASPAATPTVVEQFNLSVENPDEYHHIMELDLSTPVTLTEGQAAFVAVELPAEAEDDRACVQMCFDGWVDGFDFWSNATEAPYDWVPLSDYDVQAHLNIDLIGEYLD